MKILYHVSTLPPKILQAEAITQEISALQEHFNGQVVWVNPNRRFRYVPRLFFGFHLLRDLGAREGEVQLHHFYNPDPFPFPYLRRLKKPVLYSITCGVGDRRPNLRFFSSLRGLLVPDQRSLKRLQAWGLENTYLARPGIDTSRFSHTPAPLSSEIRLMVGSAPWTRRQFHTKGVEALLAAAQQSPHLHLTFLWRGVLSEEIERRVRRLNLDRQVTILDGLVDVNQVLAGVHASIVLAATPGLVKSYPHSLLESLAAGKPVLVSRSIPMADYVEETGCGVSVDQLTPAGICSALESLICRYGVLQESARQVGQRDFSQPAMIASYQKVYAHLVGEE
ncbi:MAG: glycosyltransferase [Chloroflexota bacterium]